MFKCLEDLEVWDRYYYDVGLILNTLSMRKYGETSFVVIMTGVPDVVGNHIVYR
jgi:hypothetical protein